MFLIPKSKIQIGKVLIAGNSGIESLEISGSVKELISKAVIKLPRNFVKKDDKGILDVIKVGDEVKIYLGYGNPSTLEYSGFVSKISDTTPLVIECENEWYPFKTVMIQPKNFKGIYCSLGRKAVLISKENINNVPNALKTIKAGKTSFNVLGISLQIYHITIQNIAVR